jgi:pimeloyl-ACP methyl ester carboxylesterase
MPLPKGDIVVVLPGILGSRLVRSGVSTWGYRAIARSFWSLGRRLTGDLALPPEAFGEEYLHCGIDDGTSAPGMLNTLGVMPGFWSVVDGYERIVDELRKRLAGDADVITYPYDWRQSNRVTASRMRDYIDPIIRRRRERWPEARLQFVSHSMGGLIACYYAEVLDRDQNTRRLISIGTPFKGSVKALGILANDDMSFGPFRLHLADLARSLPSVAELLPTYDAIGTDASSLVSLRDPASIVSGLPDYVRHHGMSFHQELIAAHHSNRDAALDYVPIVGIRQPTDEWARAEANQIVSQETPDAHQFGDGTVPRQSAVPPHWRNAAGAKFATGRHGSLQASRPVIEQVYGAVTDIDYIPMTREEDVVIRVPEVVPLAGEWYVEADSMSGDNRILLDITLTGESGKPYRFPLRPQGGGRYVAQPVVEAPGLYRWCISAPGGRDVITPISDAIFCADFASERD